MASFEWPPQGGGGGGGGNLPSTILADVAPILSGDTSVSVVFGAAFVGSPVVVPFIFSTTPGATQIFIIGSAVSSSGFTVDLSAAPMDNTYSLHWIASEVND